MLCTSLDAAALLLRAWWTYWGHHWCTLLLPFLPRARKPLQRLVIACHAPSGLSPPGYTSRESRCRVKWRPLAFADLLSVVVFLTPAGTRDEGGVIQPAYLNFDAALLGPPAHGVKVRDCVYVRSHHHILANIIIRQSACRLTYSSTACW